MNCFSAARFPSTAAAGTAILFALAAAAAANEAKVECVTPGSSGASAALLDNSTLRCALHAGENTFVVSFPDARLLDHFTVVNENAGADGELQIAVSNQHLPVNSSKWTAVEGNVAFAHKRQFDLSLLGVEAKYVKLSFRVDKGGAVAAHERQILQAVAQSEGAVFAPQVRRAIAARALDFGFTRLDVAKLRAKARVVYVSSGSRAAARKMIDGNPQTHFSFSRDDAQPTVIIEFANVAQIDRVNAIYRANGGRIDVYLLDELPSAAGDLSRGRLVQRANASGSGQATLDFDPQGARYVALQWRREMARTMAFASRNDAKNGIAGRGLNGLEFNVPGEGADVAGNSRHGGPVDLGSELPQANGGDNSPDTIEIAEIGAMGNVPASFVSSEAPELFAANAELPPINGQGRPDFSNQLGTLAEPPILAEVSP